MGKQYILTNPKVVVALGMEGVRKLINAGKYEVEREIAAFIYYPCLAVTEGKASYADVSAAFQYQGFPCRDGVMIMKYESLIRRFVVLSESETVVTLAFNPSYKEDYFGLEARIKNSDLRRYS